MIKSVNPIIMNDTYYLTLLIYSGKKNPMVSISKREFNTILYLITKQKVIDEINVLPGLGEVGFSLHFSNTVFSIDRSITMREDYLNVTYSETNSITLRKAYELFFEHFMGDDRNDLKAIVHKTIYFNDFTKMRSN